MNSSATHALSVTIAAVSLLAAGAASAQNANMMNGRNWGEGWMGGYGGVWVPILLVVAAVGVVAWIISRKDK